MPAREAASRTISHSTFGVIPVPHTRPVLLIDRNRAPSVMPAAILPLIKSRFHPPRDWHRPDMPGFAQQVRDSPVFLAQLNGINAQGEQFAPSQSASDQRREHGIVPLSS